MNKIQIKSGKINWICLGDKCPQNCCGPFKPDKNSESLWQVEKNLLPLTPEDLRNFEKHGLTKYLVQKKDGGSYIQTKKDGSCPYLKDNKCALYNVCRASTCKSYPFFFSKYNGLNANLLCPGWGRGWTSMDKVKSMVGELIKLYKWQMKKATHNLDLGESNQ